MLIVFLGCLGCRATRKHRPIEYSAVAAPNSHSQNVAVVSYNSSDPTESYTDYLPPQPLTNRSELPDRFVDLSLDEAIAIALNDTEVLRSLSASVVWLRSIRT